MAYTSSLGLAFLFELIPVSRNFSLIVPAGKEPLTPYCIQLSTLEHTEGPALAPHFHGSFLKQQTRKIIRNILKSIAQGCLMTNQGLLL